MKEYLNRIKSNAKTGEIIYWWILRALMIFAMIKGIVGLINGENDISDPLQVFGNLLAMFAWEVFMFMPEKTWARHVPSLVQDGLILMVFAASFCGKFLNFYYDVRWWDSGMHFLSGGLCVLAGYEVVIAMQKRDKKTISVPIALLCALGFSFFVSTLWELFEFTADQVMCNAATGAIGDAQHWCWTLAEGTPKAATLFDPKFTERWPLMDTMGDIVLNSIGALIAWVVLKFFPYHHKGKNDVNAMIEAELAKSAKKELSKRR
ncbi:MAG: hypothetical protein MJ168_06680 [Clostridia bacterium]|nr:hypothetical protein [Clostridia bacterium]